MIKNNKGFTLIEVIIYTALASVLVVSVVIFAFNIIFGQAKVIASQEVQENLRFAAAKLRQDIKEARDIDSLSSDTLVLDNGSDPDITYTFDGVDNKLTKQIGVNPAVDLTSDEVEISGTFINRSRGNRVKNVKINITADYPDPQGGSEYSASQSIEFAVELRGK